MQKLSFEELQKALVEYEAEVEHGGFYLEMWADFIDGKTDDEYEHAIIKLTDDVRLPETDAWKVQLSVLKCFIEFVSVDCLIYKKDLTINTLNSIKQTYLDQVGHEAFRVGIEDFCLSVPYLIE